VMGGHPCAQTPEQTDRANVSASKRYRLFPSGPTKNVPRLALAAPMLTPWAPAGLLDVVVLDDGRGVELLEQAAASRPIVTTTTIALWKFERTVFLHLGRPCSAISTPSRYYGHGCPRDCRNGLPSPPRAANLIRLLCSGALTGAEVGSRGGSDAVRLPRRASSTRGMIGSDRLPPMVSAR